MKLHSDFTINGVYHPAGSEIAWYKIYPFFLVHMAMFGGSGFVMAYFIDVELSHLYMHGGIATFAYTIFYLFTFGPEQVRWMFINGLLGIFGIYAQVGWILALFDKSISDYPWYVHVVPFFYYVLYTFLLWQAVLDLTGAREDEVRRKRTEKGYIVGSVLVYVLMLVFEGRLA